MGDGDDPGPRPPDRRGLRPGAAGPARARAAPRRGDNAPRPARDPGKIIYGDGRADGKKSLGGSGHLIEFAAPGDGRRVAGIRILGSRYGQAEPPRESFLIYFLTADGAEIVAARLAPYALFGRGEEGWADVKFATPVDPPPRFWVAVDFRPTETKGVFVSYDASTGGEHSRAGLPGLPPRKVDYGDWMIEVLLGR